MVKLFFYGSQKSETCDTQLSVKCTNSMEILIEIVDGESNRDLNIILDRTTAIKFHRELKKQIASAAIPSDFNVWNESDKI
jgi:hypothetical protein